MNQIRDSRDLERISKSVDLVVLRRYLKEVLREGLGSRQEHEVPPEELERIFEQADKKIGARFGISVWDAMVLMNQSVSRDGAENRGFDDWRRVYDWVFDVSQAHGIVVSLQEDYAGIQELTIRCQASDFDKLARILSNATLGLSEAFSVILRGSEGDAVTQEQAYQIKAT